MVSNGYARKEAKHFKVGNSERRVGAAKKPHPVGSNGRMAMKTRREGKLEGRTGVSSP
jgi:hypothetical protein